MSSDNKQHARIGVGRGSGHRVTQPVPFEESLRFIQVHSSFAVIRRRLQRWCAESGKKPLPYEVVYISRPPANGIDAEKLLPDSIQFRKTATGEIVTMRTLQDYAHILMQLYGDDM